jgi:tetratricopeptide (TPR) repeat protein/S1-C subfamily serine protease
MKTYHLLLALTFGTVAVAIPKPWLVTAQPAQIAQTDAGQIDRQIAAKRIAAKVTVRIRVGQGTGSGVLLGQKGNTYLVLTNAHVVSEQAGITIQTPDGQSYTARRVKDPQVGNFDVALLEFTSPRAYQLVGLENFGGNAALGEGQEVFAAGFPFDSNALKFVSGDVKQLPQEAFVNGTQVGYVTKGDIEQGMSGGPILDSFGNLVGINSTLAYPIKPVYKYADGSKAPQDKVAEYQQANWGVPMYNLLTRLNPDILYSYKQLPKLHRTVTPSGYMAELDRKARLVTVRIEYGKGENGSGVIVAKDGNSYSVLTAEHVVKDIQNLRVTTHDQRTYTISPSEIKRSAGTDLAVVKFTSTQPYQAATLGNYNVSDDAVVFPGGWPSPKYVGSQQWQWQLNPGGISSKEKGEMKTQDKLSFSNGYDLIYSSVTYGGMSGGPVFDNAGRVIGIHGKAEGNLDSRSVLGNSLGISIKTFVGLADRLNVPKRSLKQIDKAPDNLDDKKLKSVNLVRNNLADPKDSTDADQWIQYGNQLYRLGKYPDAVKAFDRAIALQPDSLDAYYGKGLALASKKDYVAALGAFDRAIKLVPPAKSSEFYYLWKYRSMSQRDLGRYSAALTTISDAIKLEPNDISLLNEQASLLNHFNRCAEAIKIYDRILDRKENRKAYIYSNRGNAKYNSGDKKGAIADYNIALSIDNQNASAYVNRGAAKYDLRYNKEALADYKIAISINPKLAMAYYNLGRVKSALGDQEGAIADYSMAIHIDPKDDDSYYNRGVVKSELGDKQGAIADYSMAIHINPKKTAAYNNRGNAKDKLGDKQGALSDYGMAIQIDHQYASAYYNRGSVKSELGDKKGAIADYDIFIRLDSQKPFAYVKRGKAKYALGDKKGAIDDLNIAAQMFKTQNNMAFYQEAVKLVQKFSS